MKRSAKLAAAVLGFLSWGGSAWAQRGEAGVRMLSEDAVVPPSLERPVDFGRLADRARDMPQKPAEPVRATGSWVPASSAGIPSGAVPFFERRNGYTTRGPNHARGPAATPPAPAALAAPWANEAARGYELREDRRDGSDKEAAPAKAAKPYQVGFAISAAQHAGVALILIGLTGPLRRKSQRFNGDSSEELPPIRA